MEAEIRERLGSLAELDHYQILGVERDAARGAIRKAYLMAAKRYHPDALARVCTTLAISLEPTKEIPTMSG